MGSAYTTRALELVRVLPGFTTWEDAENGFEIVSGTLNPFGAHPVEDVAIAIQTRRKMGLDTNGALLLPTDLPSKDPLPEAVNLVVPQGYSFEMYLPNNRQHPRFHAVDPVISRAIHPNHPHLFLNSGICLYACHLHVWNPDKDSLLTLMTWLSVWFACHAIWEQGGGWLGKDTPHMTAAVMALYGKNECFCGSRRTMRLCVPTHQPVNTGWQYR
jgi:hypothetical protein